MKFLKNFVLDMFEKGKGKFAYRNPQGGAENVADVAETQEGAATDAREGLRLLWKSYVDGIGGTTVDALSATGNWLSDQAMDVGNWGADQAEAVGDFMATGYAEERRIAENIGKAEVGAVEDAADFMATGHAEQRRLAERLGEWEYNATGLIADEVSTFNQKVAERAAGARGEMMAAAVETGVATPVSKEVKANRLNVRANPTTNAPVVGGVSKGETVAVVADPPAPAKADGYLWYPLQKGTGWIAGGKADGSESYLA